MSSCGELVPHSRAPKKKMPTLRRRKAKEQDKENTDDAMVDDGDDDEQEYDDGDHESDADFEGSPAKKKPKDDEELPQAPPLMDGGAARPQAPVDGGAARCGANVDVGDGCGARKKPQWSRRTSCA